jgi:hypothetical protein
VHLNPGRKLSSEMEAEKKNFYLKNVAANQMANPIGCSDVLMPIAADGQYMIEQYGDWPASTARVRCYFNCKGDYICIYNM